MLRPEETLALDHLRSSALFCWTGRSELPVPVADDRSLRLPEVILWAFQLKEGDLLTISKERVETGRLHLQSYSRAVGTIVGTIDHPWPYVEQLLQGLQASLGPYGMLSLPEESVILDCRPGESIRLAVLAAAGISPPWGRRERFFFPERSCET
jgi:hypothetical protein